MNKDEIVNKILITMTPELTPKQLSNLKACIIMTLHNCDVVQTTTSLVSLDDNDNEKYLQLFSIEKKIEGLSNK